MARLIQGAGSQAVDNGIGLVPKGESNHATANHLTLNIKAISKSVSNILNKLQVADRVEAIIKARER